MVVGQIVYLVNPYYKSGEPRECKIDKIGNKYFYVNGLKFDKVTNKHVTEHTKHKVYFSLEQRQEEIRISQLETEVYRRMREIRGLTVKQLEAIKNILDNKEKE